MINYAALGARGPRQRYRRRRSPHCSDRLPTIHYVTAPLRAAARERGDAGAISQGYSLAVEAEAGELVERWAEEAGND